MSGISKADIRKIIRDELYRQEVLIEDIRSDFSAVAESINDTLLLQPIVSDHGTRLTQVETTVDSLYVTSTVHSKQLQKLGKKR